MKYFDTSTIANILKVILGQLLQKTKKFYHPPPHIGIARELSWKMLQIFFPPKIVILVTKRSLMNVLLEFWKNLHFCDLQPRWKVTEFRDNLAGKLCIWREQNNQLKNIHKTKNVKIFFTEAIINIHKNLEKSLFGNFSPPH